jgi:hypothetical protein
MRAILKRQVWMVEGTKADGAIIVVVSIFMVMKCTPRDGEKKAKEED